MQHDLGNLLKYLLEKEIDFVLIGGFAGIVHGSSLVTKDLDICALLSEEHVAKLREALEPIHPKHRMTPQKLSFLEVPPGNIAMNNVYLETDLGVLDVIPEVKGVGGFAEISERAHKVTLFGFHCKVISIDDLIKAKRAMGREKDIQAVRELEQIQKGIS